VEVIMCKIITHIAYAFNVASPYLSNPSEEKKT